MMGSFLYMKFLGCLDGGVKGRLLVSNPLIPLGTYSRSCDLHVFPLVLVSTYRWTTRFVSSMFLTFMILVSGLFLECKRLGFGATNK